jgi:hypothetical protein
VLLDWLYIISVPLVSPRAAQVLQELVPGDIELVAANLPNAAAQHALVRVLHSTAEPAETLQELLQHPGYASTFHRSPPVGVGMFRDGSRILCTERVARELEAAKLVGLRLAPMRDGKPDGLDSAET